MLYSMHNIEVNTLEIQRGLVELTSNPDPETSKNIVLLKRGILAVKLLAEIFLTMISGAPISMRQRQKPDVWLYDRAREMKQTQAFKLRHGAF